MKEKLTLLIALSIFILLTAASFIVQAVKPEVDIIQEIEPQVIEEEVVELLPVDEIAKQVINGAWGSGEQRYSKLSKAGYNPQEVQKAVNDILIITKPAPVLNQTETMQLVWNVMKEKGWNNNLCAAILGNMIAESNVNPNAIGDSGRSFGLCQWNGNRRITLENSFGIDIQGQINFLEYELQKGYPYILYSDGTCEEIAYSFCVNFERPSNKYAKAEHRKTLARQVYTMFVN